MKEPNHDFIPEIKDAPAVQETVLQKKLNEHLQVAREQSLTNGETMS